MTPEQCTFLLCRLSYRQTSCRLLARIKSISRN